MKKNKHEKNQNSSVDVSSEEEKRNLADVEEGVAETSKADDRTDAVISEPKTVLEQISKIVEEGKKASATDADTDGKDAQPAEVASVASEQAVQPAVISPEVAAGQVEQTAEAVTPAAGQTAQAAEVAPVSSEQAAQPAEAASEAVIAPVMPASEAGAPESKVERVGASTECAPKSVGPLEPCTCTCVCKCVCGAEITCTMTRPPDYVPGLGKAAPAEEKPGSEWDRFMTSPEDARGEAGFAFSSEEEKREGIDFAGMPGTGAIRTDEPSPGAVPGGPDPQAKGAPLGAKPTPKAKPKPKPKPKEEKPGLAVAAFNGLALLSLLGLAAILVIQTLGGAIFPGIYIPVEESFINNYNQMLSSGQWLTPPYNAALPAAMPGFFWLVRALDFIPFVDGPLLYALASFAGALTALFGAYTLALACGFGNRAAFASGLVMLSSAAFMGLSHFVGPDLFFAGVMALALAFLHRGWASERSFTWIILGFIFTGLSTLCGGFIGFALPLLASIIFIVWRGTFRRANKLDAVFGFVLMLMVILGWLGAIIGYDPDNGYLPAFLAQTAMPFVSPLWPPKEPLWIQPAILAGALVPWIFVIPFVSWGKVAGGSISTLASSRRESSGGAWLWICLVIGLALITFVAVKPVFAVAIILPVASALLGRAVMRLEPGNSRAFFGFMAFLLFVLAVVLGMASASPAQMAAKMPAHFAKLLTASARGLPFVAGILGLGALVLWKLTRRSFPGGAMAVVVLFACMLVQPATLLISPALDGVVGKKLFKDVPGFKLPADFLPMIPGLPREAAPVRPAPGAVKPAPFAPVAPAAPAAPASDALKPASGGVSSEEAKPAAEGAKPAPAAPTAPAFEVKPAPAPGAASDAAKPSGEGAPAQGAPQPAPATPRINQ